jgi:selenocysteine lyase/cysteine desulfurase
VSWEAVRARFPAAARYTYLNTAGAPPISTDVARAGRRYYDEMLADADMPWERWLAEVEQVRQAVARFVRSGPDDIAFITNTSDGMNLVAQMIGPPGPVVTMADEFPTSTLPWLVRGRRLQLVASDERGEIHPDAVARALTDDTVALVTSHVQFRTGFRCDLQALARVAHGRGLPLIVDAAQSAGAVPIDVERDGVDALMFSGYKWPMAGYGSGALYLSPSFRARFEMPSAGWMSAAEPDRHVNDRLDLKHSAAVLEVGCPNFAGIFALGAAVELLEAIGVERVAARIDELTGYLHARLDALGYVVASPRLRRRRAGITIIASDRADAIVDGLARRRIIVSARGRGIRVSVHVFNLAEDIDRLIEGLEELRARCIIASPPGTPSSSDRAMGSG